MHFSKLVDYVKWQGLYLNQSYEIKLPPRAILGFKILEIFSVEYYDKLGVIM